MIWHTGKHANQSQTLCFEFVCSVADPLRYVCFYNMQYLWFLLPIEHKGLDIPLYTQSVMCYLIIGNVYVYIMGVWKLVIDHFGTRISNCRIVKSPLRYISYTIVINGHRLKLHDMIDFLIQNHGILGTFYFH